MHSLCALKLESEMRTPVLKIINSWRFHFSKQKRRTIGQATWNLLFYYLFPKDFLTQLSTVERKVVSNHLFKMNLMIPFWPKLIWTLSIVCLINCVSLRDYFSPLYIDNKVSSRTTFATIFFPFNLFQGTAKPQNRRGKVKTR